jgi:hypothetical protein
VAEKTLTGVRHVVVGGDRTGALRIHSRPRHSSSVVATSVSPQYPEVL